MHAGGRGPPRLPSDRTRVLWIDLGGVVLKDPRPIVARRLVTKGVTLARLRTEYYRLSRRLDTDAIDLRTLHARLRKVLDLPVGYPEFRALVCDRSLAVHAPVLRALRLLRRSGRVRVVFASNVSRPVWQAIERKFALGQYADASVLSFRARLLKPDPKFFREALRVSHATPGEVRYLDDARENVEAARRMGVRSFRVATPSETVRRLREISRSITR